MKPPFGIHVAPWGGLELPPETTAAGWTVDPNGYAAANFRDPMGRFVEIRRNLAERVLGIINRDAPSRRSANRREETERGRLCHYTAVESNEELRRRTEEWLATAELPPSVAALCKEWHDGMIYQGYLPPVRTP